MPTRRRFLQASFPAMAGGLVAFRTRLPRRPLRPLFPDPSRGYHGESSLAAALRVPTPLWAPADHGELPVATAPPSLSEGFSDLNRHFLFEYYPWYGTNPFRHWEQWDRNPPVDIASNLYPSLGAYDSRARAVVEAHARAIAASGAGGISLSWWGRDSFEDRNVPLVMDIMRDHDLKVAFHLEPYADDRALRWSEDILYLIREYGDRRRWDTLLLLGDASGTASPVFKGFRTILPERATDCHGAIHWVPDYAPDSLWRRQNLGLKRLLVRDFPELKLFADSLDFDRVTAAGFDGIAIYDNFVRPSSYLSHAAGASEHDLLFSFNVNPGYDGIEPRVIEPGSCYAPTPLEPPAPDLDWSEPGGCARAAVLHSARIHESLAATLACQADPTLLNAHRGFFLAYINSWNEWHEGHAFEPMADRLQLTPQQRAIGYHNPIDGDYRLTALSAALAPILNLTSHFAPIPDPAHLSAASTSPSLSARDAHLAQRAFGR